MGSTRDNVLPLKFEIVREDKVSERRRIRLPEHPDYQLMKKVMQKWSDSNWSKTEYLDDEGEFVLFNSEIEWKECLKIWNHSEMEVLTIRLHIPKENCSMNDIITPKQHFSIIYSEEEHNSSDCSDVTTDVVRTSSSDINVQQISETDDFTIDTSYPSEVTSDDKYISNNNMIAVDTHQEVFPDHEVQSSTHRNRCKLLCGGNFQKLLSQQEVESVSTQVGYVPSDAAEVNNLLSHDIEQMAAREFYNQPTAMDFNYPVSDDFPLVESTDTTPSSSEVLAAFDAAIADVEQRKSSESSESLSSSCSEYRLQSPSPSGDIVVIDIDDLKLAATYI